MTYSFSLIRSFTTASPVFTRCICSDRIYCTQASRSHTFAFVHDQAYIRRVWRDVTGRKVALYDMLKRQVMGEDMAILKQPQHGDKGNHLQSGC